MTYEELPNILKSVFERAVDMTPGVDEEDIEAVRATYVRLCEKTLYEEKERRSSKLVETRVGQNDCVWDLVEQFAAPHFLN